MHKLYKENRLTHSDTVMNSKLQLESPISSAEAIPAGASWTVYGCQAKIGLLWLVQYSHTIRQAAASMNFTTRWVITIDNG